MVQIVPRKPIHNTQVSKNKAHKIMRDYCIGNIRKFMQQTTLHGFKFITDQSITIWERSFFLSTFLAAFIITFNLIINIYSRWNSTPVIIGISPHPTSIGDIPFPAITICNMNQVLLSKVANYSEDSFEYGILKLLCFTENEFNEQSSQTPNFRNNTLDISDFVVKHAQPCSKMLVDCQIGYSKKNCSGLFRDVMTDEGLCCVFNVLHPNYLYKGQYTIIKDYELDNRTVPINWNPETGYPSVRPDKYYPRPGAGTGVSMGLSIMLNVELDEYYCSSTNGPGFKISLHNPIETPNVKETGLTVPIGYETRFRIDAVRSEAMPSIRSIDRNSRQCLFNDEEKLLYHKYYTRRNCESECQAKYMHSVCQCIPYNLPRLYMNASICNTKQTKCINGAMRSWTEATVRTCRDRCLPNCFDLNFEPDAFIIPLACDNFTIQNVYLRSLPREYVKRNIAIIHFYYRESVFHGDLKNIYIGLTEFLSNTGGILGLFMGFSFISVAEIIYFAFLLPIFEIITMRKQREHKPEHLGRKPRVNTVNKIYNNWLSSELYKPPLNYDLHNLKTRH